MEWPLLEEALVTYWYFMSYAGYNPKLFLAPCPLICGPLSCYFQILSALRNPCGNHKEMILGGQYQHDFLPYPAPLWKAGGFAPSHPTPAPMYQVSPVRHSTTLALEPPKPKPLTLEQDTSAWMKWANWYVYRNSSELGTIWSQEHTTP